MNDWQTFVVVATALGLMPMGSKRVVYSIFASFVMSRLMTLVLLLFSAGLVYVQEFAGYAVALALFSANLVRRNGGGGAMFYTATVLALTVALLGVLYLNNEWLGLIVGVPWFVAAVIWFKLLVWVTDEKSWLNRLPYLVSGAGFVCLGAGAFYGPDWAQELLASSLPGWGGVAVVAAVVILMSIVMRSKHAKHAESGYGSKSRSFADQVGRKDRKRTVNVEPVWGSRSSMDMDEMAFFNNSM